MREIVNGIFYVLRVGCQARVRERNNPRLRLLDGDDMVQTILTH